MKAGDLVRLKPSLFSPDPGPAQLVLEVFVFRMMLMVKLHGAKHMLLFMTGLYFKHFWEWLCPS